jgi:V-type H+-transporting ATPase subunit a
VFATLNLCNTAVSNKTVVAEGWVPVKKIPEVRAALLRGMRRSRVSSTPVMSLIDTDATVKKKYRKKNPKSSLHSDVV